MDTQNVSIIGIGGVLNRLDRLKKLPPKYGRLMMAEIGEMVIARILNRTMKGIDVNNTAFKPYSPKYAAFREELGLPVSKVDLKVTGMMLSAMTYQANRDEIRIFFQNITDSSDTSIPMKAYFLDEERNFFAMNEKDREKALLVVDSYFKKANRKG